MLTRRRVIGIGTILAGIALIALATLQPDPFDDSRSIYARFDNVHGLGSIDRNVRVGGANIGEIDTVEREGDDVVVELELEPGVVVHEDARVELRPHTLFEGSAFVDFEPGSPSAPPLETGAVIGSDRTSTYVSLDEAARVLREPNRKAFRDLVEFGSEVLRGRAITGVRRALKTAPPLVRDLGPTARALRGPDGDELGGAVRGMSRTVDALATRERHFAPLVRDTNRTLAALEVDGGLPLDAALAAMPAPLERLEASGADLEQLAARVDELAVELTPAARELAPLLRESRPVLRRSIPVIEQTTPLIGDLRTILARFAAASPELSRVIARLKPGARILHESVLPFLLRDSKLGVPTYIQLVSAFSGGTASLRPYETAAQGSMGEGHVLRLSAFFDKGFFGATGAPTCDTYELIDAEAAKQLEALGLCSP